MCILQILLSNLQFSSSGVLQLDHSIPGTTTQYWNKNQCETRVDVSKFIALE